ncbi:hypothetical protein Tco_0538409 [Tanacetum coccineum]
MAVNVNSLEQQLEKYTKELLSLKDKAAETKAFRIEVAKVRAERKPREKKLNEHQGKLEVASTEKKILSEKNIKLSPPSPPPSPTTVIHHHLRGLTNGYQESTTIYSASSVGYNLISSVGAQRMPSQMIPTRGLNNNNNGNSSSNQSHMNMVHEASRVAYLDAQKQLDPPAISTQELQICKVPENNLDVLKVLDKNLEVLTIQKKNLYGA